NPIYNIHSVRNYSTSTTNRQNTEAKVRSMLPERCLLRRLLACGVVLAALAGCRKTPAGKPIQLKVLLPAKDAKVFVDDQEIKGEGEERTIATQIAPDKNDFLVKATWEPNNYTKITRPRKVAFK